MTELRVSHLIEEANEMLDNKFHVGNYCLFVNTDDIQDILSKISAILPEEIKTAEMILKRRDDIYMEAQSRADRIISEAQNTAAKILSESEVVRLAREQATQIHEQLRVHCEEMKNNAIAEVEELRKTAYKEAMQTREGAQAYAEKVLNDLERDIEQIHRIVRNGQDYLVQQKEKSKNVQAQIEQQ